MSVKILSQQDVDKFYPVYSSVLKTEFPGYSSDVINYLLNRIYTPASLKFWIQKNEKFIYAALHDDQIVGFALIDLPYGGVSFCRWLGVVTQYQKQGCGTELIAAGQKHACAYHAHKMEVASQPEAKEFYEKIGFIFEGLRKSSYFGIDQYLFGKIIAQPNSTNMTR